MKKVFISRKLPKFAEQTVTSRYSCIIWESDNPPALNDLMEIAPDIDGMISMLTDPLPEEFFKAAVKLRALSQMSVGTDNIDISAAIKRKIPVGHTPDVLTEACADHTWALLLAVARRVTESNSEVHEGIWRPWGPDVLCGEDVFGGTLGIIGFGRIGKAVAKRASGFAMHVLYTSNGKRNFDGISAEKVSLNALLHNSDFISLHVPLVEKTRNLLSVDEFKLMKKNAILINTSRGLIINSDALTNALSDQLIRGAGLDVFEPEPIPYGHPLLSMANVVITPHIASATKQTREKMAIMSVNNLIAAMEGNHMPYCVNPQVYE